MNPIGGLGPTDYFGRTMVENLPKSVRIGVIPVAMGGSPIEMFDKDLYQQKLADNPTEWWATLANQHYGGNPYGRIIEMAKKAQEVGVIKGITPSQSGKLASLHVEGKWLVDTHGNHVVLHGVMDTLSMWFNGYSIIRCPWLIPTLLSSPQSLQI